MAKAEATNDSTTMRLTEVGEAIAALHDDADDIILCLDVRGIIRYINRAEVREEVLSRHASSFVAHEHVAQVAALLERVLATGVSASYDSLSAPASARYRSRIVPLVYAGAIEGAVVVARKLAGLSSSAVVDAIRATMQKRPHVLVVDGEPLIGKALRRMLAASYDVEVARRFDEVMSLMTRGARYDVVVCDLSLRGPEGATLHAAIADIDEEQAKRMVFMTAAIVHTDAERAFLATRELLAKPFAAGDLKVAIERVLRERSA